MIRVDSSICRSFLSTAAMYMAQSVGTCSVVPSANDISNIAGPFLAVFRPLTFVFQLFFSSLNATSFSPSSVSFLVTSAAHSRLRSRFFWTASSVFNISSGCGSSSVEFAHDISGPSRMLYLGTCVERLHVPPTPCARRQRLSLQNLRARSRPRAIC